jgi:hypothetical protein
MSRFDHFSRAGVALVAAGCFTMAGCSATKQAVSNAGDAAKTAATAAGQAALAPALNPVLDLLSKGQADLKSGNVGTAISALGGFQNLWEKAGPLIQPLAGEKWGAIDSAAQTVISTFGAGAKPDAATAASAISGLLGPLKALAGQ